MSIFKCAVDPEDTLTVGLDEDPYRDADCIALHARENLDRVDIYLDTKNARRLATKLVLLADEIETTENEQK